ALRVYSLDRGAVACGRLLVADVERGAVDADDLGRELLAGAGLEDRLDGPVFAGGEGGDLTLALDHEAEGDRLDATRRQAAAHPARPQPAQRARHPPTSRRGPCATRAGSACIRRGGRRYGASAARRRGPCRSGAGARTPP